MVYSCGVQTEWTKIPSVFVKDSTGKAIPEVNLAALWVLESAQGLMTIKMDGICCRLTLEDSKWRVGKRMDDGKFMNIAEDDFIDKRFWDAFHNMDIKSTGIFEAYGKDFKGNPYGLGKNLMVKIQPVDSVLIVPRPDHKIRRGPGVSAKDLFEAVRQELVESPEIEGLVFHLEKTTGMQLEAIAKVKKVDFGLQWPTENKLQLVN